MTKLSITPSAQTNLAASNNKQTNKKKIHAISKKHY